MLSSLADMYNHELVEDAENPEILSYDCLHDAVNFLSLPTEEQISVANESRDWFTGIVHKKGSQMIAADSSPLQVSSSEISEMKMYEICQVYETRCSCPKPCNTCSKLIGLGDLCDCDEINVAALRTRINKDITEKSDVVLENNKSISRILWNKNLSYTGWLPQK